MDERIKDRADWLVDAVATATQNRQFLRGDSECDEVACSAIFMSGEKAMRQVAEPLKARIRELEVRADHALSLVAEAYEVAWRAAFRACDAKEAGYIDENSRMAARIERELRLEVAKAVKALTPSDALAAREARDKRVRDEALREAADVIAERGMSSSDDWDRYRAILALIEGEKTNESK